MDGTQRRVIAAGAYAVAIVLFVMFFARPFWAWASWNESKGTLDLGFLKVSSRPPFPDDARSVIAGLLLPIAIATAGRVFEASKAKA